MLLNFPCVVVILMFPSFIPHQQKNLSKLWLTRIDQLSFPSWARILPFQPRHQPHLLRLWTMGSKRGRQCRRQWGWQCEQLWVTIPDNPWQSPLNGSRHRPSPPAQLHVQSQSQSQSSKSKTSFPLPFISTRNLRPIPPCNKHWFSTCFSVPFTHIKHQCLKNSNWPV